MNRDRDYHEEVVQALRAIGDPRLGEAIRRDRGSQLEHLGIRFPALSKRVKQGFSFSDLPEEQVLEIWDELWASSQPRSPARSRGGARTAAPDCGRCGRPAFLEVDA